MINVLLNGSEGRMGKAVSNIVYLTEGVKISSACDAGKVVETVIGQEAENVSVVLDISSPRGFADSLAWAVKNKKPFVSGTTGLNEKDMEKLEEASKKIAVLYASNMSRGVNILFEVLKNTAALTMDADIEIVEMHHNRKKDAPSGTALTLGNIIKENQQSRKLNDVKSRDGIIGERSGNEIGYSSIRCGDVPGEHTVIFAFEGERIEITHRALSRDVLARGAVLAVKFLSGKPAGKYSMKDVVNSK
jgi:4-hydroxy-tetrahydrodipicolinate reductase